ncbi:MAG: FGGY family carbohydrate kinase, partial [Steroidobacteraceae bacterium]
MSRYILALDQGTTSSRSILFDHGGRIVALAQREFSQHFPRSGWVEHDAEEIWSSQSATIDEVLVRAGCSAADLAAVGITNQRETTVLWERASGRPVAPAIVWQDRRTAPLCEALRAEGHEPEFTRRTGLLLDPYFSGTKLAWLLDQDAALRRRAERGELAFGTIDSWLAWQLSGGASHVTDVSNASRTLLMNLATGEWDPTLLELLRIPPAVLPQILPSGLAPGQVTAQIGGRALSITGIAGDQQAALFGQACFRPGMAKNTYGTGCFMLM